MHSSKELLLLITVLLTPIVPVRLHIRSSHVHRIRVLKLRKRQRYRVVSVGVWPWLCPNKIYPVALVRVTVYCLVKQGQYNDSKALKVFICILPS